MIEKTYAIRTLVDLDKIDAKLLSKLERISLELPNCELINEQATVEINKILESYDNIYTLRKLYHEMGDLFAMMTFFTMGLAIPVIGIISAYCGIYNMVVKQKIKTKSYEEFCRLREKIIATYKMPANYRSYPALELKVLE